MVQADWADLRVSVDLRVSAEDATAGAMGLILQGSNPKTSSYPRHLLTYNIVALMKAYVYVSLKKSVLDPQGKTIHSALKKIGFKGLEEVRQGKYFELTLNGGLSKAEAEAEIGRIARDVLTNPVIEEFRFSLED
jgi:phosphoribosylformylglycinamidine synthase subunit PurS